MYSNLIKIVLNNLATARALIKLTLIVKLPLLLTVVFLRGKDR